jgi:aminoglycoside phosphotransferase (APT) family kinase protein
VAILDWEMSTLGDPLTDVGMVAVYWTEVGEFMWRNRGVPQPHRANAGFPSVDVLLSRYEQSSGRHLDHIDFYRTLATFKLAVITEGAHARAVKSGDSARIQGANESCEGLARMALDYAATLT